MTMLDVAATAAPAVLRSRLLKPPGPQAIWRIIHSGFGYRANPAAVLALSAARWPARTAIIDDEGAISYRDLLAQTESITRALYFGQGLRPGEPVGVMCRNGRGFVQALFAAASIGADVVLLNADFNVAALASTLASHQIRIVVCDKEFRDTIGKSDPEVSIVDAAVAPTDEGPRLSAGKPGRIVVLTSGTTGVPKGVPRTPDILQVLGVAATVLHRTRLRVGTRIVIAVPFFHAFGLAVLMLALAIGGTVITRRRFDAEAALAQASLHAAQAFAAVPIMLTRILDLPERARLRNPARGLRVVVSGGSPLDPALAQRFMDEFGDVLYNGYGSSEVGIGSFATPHDLRRAPATVGRPVAGSPVRIIDDDDHPVATGTVGRVFVGGRLNFDGYTSGARKPVVAGMTGTGDLGYVDEHGCLYIVGREDDMIVSGGENVYPQVVEHALAEHPDIADNAVVGVPDDDYGQRLAAFVVTRPDARVGEAELRTYLKQTVSRFEQPRDIRFVTEIPRNSTGKILRKELQI